MIIRGPKPPQPMEATRQQNLLAAARERYQPGGDVPDVMDFAREHGVTLEQARYAALEALARK